jgi:hypothetical protein
MKYEFRTIKYESGTKYVPDSLFVVADSFYWVGGFIFSDDYAIAKYESANKLTMDSFSMTTDSF